MQAEQAQAVAREDQMQANFREALRPYTDVQLKVLAIDLIERPHTVEVQGMSALAAIAVMREVNRREMETT
jgi:hypothetical protein